MIVKTIIFEDFTNYKKPSMVIGMPYCSFKCNKECGEPVCQNSDLATASDKDIPIRLIVGQYLGNDISQSIIFQGLEPFDSWDELLECISIFRKYTQDDIVIYTGYTEEEASFWISFLEGVFNNIIIKFGRFIPNQKSHFDPVLEVDLASDNQYAKKIS